MSILDKYKAWASQTFIPEEAFETVDPSDIDPGDLSILETVFSDFSDDFEIPLPDELIAHRLSVWAGQQVPVDSPLVQDHEKYYNLVLDMDYPDNLDTNQLNNLKQFKILLMNSVSPELKDDIVKVFDNILGLSDGPTVEKAYVVKPYDGMPGMVVAIINNGLIALIRGNVVKVFDKNKNMVDVNEDAILQGVKNAPKSIINNEQLVSLIGQELYQEIEGNDGIDFFDIP